MRKILPITGALLLVSGGLTSWAAPLIYEIPATQEEFDSQWETVANDDPNTWEWVEAETPYAQITPLNSVTGSPNARPADAQDAAILFYKEPFKMKAGETYSIQVKGASRSWNDEEVVYIVIGTDPAALTPISQTIGTFKIYPPSSSAAFPSFVVRPSDSNADRLYSVEADGDYYIGIQSNYAQDKESDKVLLFQSLIVEKQVDYPQRVTGTKATADPNGEHSVTLEWTWPTQTKNNVAISGSLGANIYRLKLPEGESSYWSPSKTELYLPENLIATIENGEPGTKGGFIDNAENSLKPITEDGKYYYYIAPFTDDGENSECSSAQIFSVKWVGEGDKPWNAVNGEGKAVGSTVVLTWKNRAEAKNDGVFKPEKLYNRIERKKDNGEYEVIEEKYLEGDVKAETVSYTDTHLDGFGTYSYKIYIGYGDTLSEAHEINNIVGGGGLEIPYNQDFSESDSFSSFTIEGGDYNGKWTKVSDYVKLSPYNTVTCTLFTPPLSLEAGKTYRVSVTAWGDTQTTSSGSSGGGYWDDDDDLGYGWGDEEEEEIAGSYPLTFIAGSTVKTDEGTEIGNYTVTATSSNKQTVEGYFAPEETGVYYFGFKSTTGSNKGIYLDDIAIEATTVIPAMVSDLAVTPDAAGADSAELSFTIPAKSNAGVNLESVSKVVVKRYDEGGEAVEVKSIEEGIVPGQAVMFTDEVPEAGMYTYGVVIYSGEETSAEAKSEGLWIGYDVPKAMSSMGVHLSLDDTATPVITWEALSGTVKTLHGGYIDMDNLKYRIYRIHAKNLDAERVLVGETGELEFRDADLHESEYGEYRYGVAALNGTFEGKAGETSNKINGGMVDINYEPDLTDDKVVESFEGRGFLSDGGITWKNGGDSMIDENYSFLPTFRYTENETTGVKATLSLSRGSAQYEELLEVYLCTVESVKSDLREEDRAHAAAVTIRGKDKMQLIQTIPVHAMPSAPEEVAVPVDIPQNGKYRLALRCASEYNSKLTVHTLKVEPFSNPATGIEEIAVEDMDSNSSYFTLQGIEVKNPAPGIYIRVSDGKAVKVRL